jgi:ring-1,2-phenylacetyl-CoA epoxidase subunit PaaE
VTPLPAFQPIPIAAVRRETADAVALTLAIPDALRAAFVWQPGQYLTLRTMLDGEELRRSYSICSGLDDGVLELAVKLVDGGRFSSWAHQALQPGHLIDVMPPAGRFTVPLDPAARRSYLGVAAGSGITPVLSILKSVLNREPGSRFVLLYGSRSTAGILFREQLEALKDRFMHRLSVVHVLSREQQDIPVLNGRLDGAKLATLLPGLFPGALPDYALLCGPGEMITAMSGALRAAGMAAERIRSERFSTGSPPSLRVAQPRPAAPAFTAPAFVIATVIADGVRTQIPVGEGEPVLDAALRAGLDLPYSCRAGMCSTCRARVTDGAVTMDVNYGLEPWETAAGYVLTCQARPTTTALTVDYDQV